MQVVEEEFKHTAANLGWTGAESNALAHQWTSPEGMGFPSGNPEAFDDSAHSRADTSQSGQSLKTHTAQQYHILHSSSLSVLCTLNMCNNHSLTVVSLQ